jgi:hypothetical protein
MTRAGQMIRPAHRSICPGLPSDPVTQQSAEKAENQQN